MFHLVEHDRKQSACEVELAMKRFYRAAEVFLIDEFTSSRQNQYFPGKAFELLTTLRIQFQIANTCNKNFLISTASLQDTLLPNDILCFYFFLKHLSGPES